MPRPRTKNKHLPPSIYPKHGAFYLVIKGKWHHIGYTLGEALAEYARRHGTAKGTMPALIDEYLDSRSGLSDSTKAHYRSVAQKLNKILVEFSPQSVTSGHIVSIRRSMQKTPGMANLCLTFLRQVFDYALEQQLVTSNPVVGVKRNRMLARDRTLTMPEFEAIREKAGPRLQVIMNLLYLTGQRVGDVLTIKRANLLPEGIAFTQQKTGNRLVVRWGAELREAVETARKLNGNVLALTLLHNRRGKAPDYNTVLSQWRKACRLASVQNARMHDIRSMAAMAVEKPKELLGHTDEKTTKTYLRGKAIPIVDGPSFGRLIDDSAQVVE